MTREEYIQKVAEIQQKIENLFTPGHIDSYHRDRYERHDALILELRRLNWAVDMADDDPWGETTNLVPA